MAHEDLLKAVRDVSLAVGLRISEDRYDVIALVLEAEGFTLSELACVIHDLMTSKDLSDEIRYGGTLTPAHFVEARRSVRRRLAAARRAHDLLQRSIVTPEEMATTTVCSHWLLETNADESSVRPSHLPEAGHRETPSLPARTCPKHPTRELFDDGFCAACENERLAAA